MNKYFNAFENKIKWFNYQKEPIEIFEIETFNLTRKFQETYPNLTELINQSVKTGVEFKGKTLVLFTWETGEETSGWMCQFDSPEIQLIEEHQILIDNIGGIIETFNGPESIALNGINYNYTLTLNQNFMFVGSMNTDKPDWEDYYINRCAEFGTKPIDLSNAVLFTKEANGATYFYDSVTKEVKLFSHDHAFEFVEFLPNHPEYTIHKIKGVNNFIEFVELMAVQWKEHFEIRKKAAEHQVGKSDL